MCWSWDETPEKARRQVTIDEPAGVARVLRGSRGHLVQRGTLAYPGPDGLAREEVLVKPLVLPHGAAGGTLAALQLRWSELGLHPMKLARVVRVMVLCLSVDMASSNIKLLGFLIRVLPKNILILPLYCMLHQIHRVVAGFDKHMPVASEAYSLSKIMAIDNYFEKMLRNMATLVRRDCRAGGICRGVAPPADCRHRRRAVIMACFNVDIDVDYAARLDLPSPVRARSSAICHAANILNGDWRQERVAHYCMGCCPPGGRGGGGQSRARVSRLDCPQQASGTCVAPVGKAVACVHLVVDRDTCASPHSAFLRHAAVRS